MTEIPAGPWRTGAHVGKNLYIEDGSGQEGRGQDVGRMDTPELAAYVVACVNFHQEVDGQLSGAVGRLGDPLPRDAPEVLAERRPGLHELGALRARSAAMAEEVDRQWDYSAHQGRMLDRAQSEIKRLKAELEASRDEVAGLLRELQQARAEDAS